MYFLVFLSLQFCIKKRFFSYLYTDCTIPMILYPYYNFNVRWSCVNVCDTGCCLRWFGEYLICLPFFFSGFHFNFSVCVRAVRPGLPQGLLSGGGRILSPSHPDQLTHISYRCLITHSQESTLFNIHSLTQRVYTLCYHSVSFVPRVE